MSYTAPGATINTLPGVKIADVANGDVLTYSVADQLWENKPTASIQHALLDGFIDIDTVAHAPIRGDLIAGNATPAWVAIAIGASGKFLRSNGTDPSWQSISAGDLPAAITSHALLDGSVDNDTLAGAPVEGDILIANSTPKWAKLAIGATGKFIRSNGTDPSWQAIASGDLPVAITSHALLDGSVDNDTLAGAPARGDFLIGNSTPKWTKLAVGASAQFLRSNGTDPSWQTIASGDLPVAITSHALLDGSVDNDTVAGAPVRGDVLIGNSTPAWTKLAIGSSAKFLRSNGTDPSWQTIVSGDLPAAITAHALLDGSVDNDTLAGAPVQGDLIVGNATPKWAKVAIGGAATFLRSDGTTASWQAIAAGDLPEPIGKAFVVAKNTVAMAAGLTAFLGMIDFGAVNLTEANVQTPVPKSCTVQNLYVNVIQNSINTGTSTITGRKGGVDNILTVNIAAGVVSVVSDTTHSPSLSSGNLFDWKIVTSGTTGTLTFIIAAEMAAI